jgi:hypothetical protein
MFYEDFNRAYSEIIFLDPEFFLLREEHRTARRRNDIPWQATRQFRSQ